MGIKSKYILDEMENILSRETKNEEYLSLKFEDDGIWFIFKNKDNKQYFVEKEISYSLVGEILGYLGSFDEDIPEMIGWMESILEELKKELK